MNPNNEKIRKLLKYIPQFSYEKVIELVPEYESIPADETVIYAIRKSGLFNTYDYLDRYKDVALAGTDAAYHFIKYGIYEGRKLLLNENSQVISKDINRIYRQGSLNELYSMPLKINWMLTNMCNYNCSYCFGHDKIDKNKFIKFDKIKKALDRIYSLNRPAYWFTFTGGECSIHPDFISVIEYTAIKFEDRLTGLQVLTNGSHQPGLYEKMRDLSRYCYVTLDISLHTEYVDMQHIAEIIENLSSNILLIFHIMFNPAKREITQSIFNILCKLRKQYYFSIGITTLRAGENFSEIDKRYVAQDFEWREQSLKEFSLISDEATKNGIAYKGKPIPKPDIYIWEYNINGELKIEQIQSYDRTTFFREGMFNFKNMWCVLGHSLLHIRPEGSAHGAVCGHASGKYNIFETNPYDHNDFIRPILCPLSNCGCDINYSIPKFSDAKEAYHFCEIMKANQKNMRSLNR